MNFNPIETLREEIANGKFDNVEMERLLCKGLMMPFTPTSSGSRKQMFGAQLEQVLGLIRPELPRIQTGYENGFGDRSSSLIITKENLVVIEKVSKFSFDPNRFYYLIVFNPNTNQFDIIERKDYEHITESYGILYNNKYLDKLNPGNKIPQNTTIRKSLAYDEFNNRCDGVNLLCTYLSMEGTKEDGIVLGKEAAKKLSCGLVKKILIQINDNDIPMNLYARNIDDYKCFPDIGETTEFAKGILMALRREKKEEMLFSQSRKNLSKIMISDDKFVTDGRVVDIDVYCNNKEIIDESYYYSQIKFYNDERIRFMTEFVQKTENLINSNYNCSYELKKIYTNFKNIINGGQYIKDKVFSNLIIELTVVEESPVRVGDKIANRYGGKGVVSQIIPDEMMPLLDNGRRVELIYNSSTCINRENNGQLNEMYLNYVSNRIVDHVKSLDTAFDLNYVLNLYIDYLSCINEDLAKNMEEYILSADPEDQVAFLQKVFDDGFILSIDPEAPINIDTFAKIKEKFPFVEQYKIKVAQLGSDGKYRYINTRRRLECGEQYIWRLKQYAEEKFSVVSLSATNLKNENVRNNSKRSYKTPYAKTCVRFGDMETGDLLHLGVESVITNLLLTSLSPKARRKVGEELTEGPIFDIDMKLNEDCSNRSVEILNAYLLTIGLRLVFMKIPRRVKKPIRYITKKSKVSYRKAPRLKRPMIFYSDSNNFYVPVTVGEETLKDYKKGGK